MSVQLPRLVKALQAGFDEVKFAERTGRKIDGRTGRSEGQAAADVRRLRIAVRAHADGHAEAEGVGAEKDLLEAVAQVLVHDEDEFAAALGEAADEFGKIEVLPDEHAEPADPRFVHADARTALVFVPVEPRGHVGDAENVTALGDNCRAALDSLRVRVAPRDDRTVEITGKEGDFFEFTALATHLFFIIDFSDRAEGKAIEVRPLRPPALLQLKEAARRQKPDAHMFPPPAPHIIFRLRFFCAPKMRTDEKAPGERRGPRMSFLPFIRFIFPVPAAFSAGKQTSGQGWRPPSSA